MQHALLLAAASALVAAGVPDTPAPPPTPKKPVTDTYFGTAVVDDYRWLENFDDKAVQDWSDAQNARARKILDGLPNRKKIEKRLTELLSFESPSYRAVLARGGGYFALKQQPPKQQPFIVVLPSLGGSAGEKKGMLPIDEKIAVDPNDLDKTGGTSIDFFVPSPDGKYLAASLSQGGSETGTVHVFARNESGPWKDVDSVPRANTGTAGGTLAWKRDASGFWYTRHPQAPEVQKDDDGFFQQVAFHKLGTPASADVVELGAVTGGTRGDLPRNAENFLEASDDGRFVADLVQKGDGGEYDLWLRATTAKSKWRKVAGYDERIVAVRFGPDGTLWLLSRKDASKGKIMKLPATAASTAQATLVVPAGDATIEAFEVTAHNLFLVEQLGGPSRVRTMKIDVALAAAEGGTKSPGVELALLPTSSAGALVRAEPAGEDAVVFAQQSYTVPPAWFVADGTGKVLPTSVLQKAPADMSDVAVQRRTTKSKDGTEVPYTVISLNGVKIGDAPTLLTGYGGFSISLAPAFNKSLRAWLEQGGVYVVANMRGGGEFGEAWHQGGMKLQKQHVFDDFIAVAEALTSGDTPITKPSRLAIEGGSNGGLLMGAALTQRPELFAAVVARVGYFDMLRYETKPNGAFNATEYGSVNNEDEFKALQAYSPYHHVVDGTKYPPSLFMTGKNDPRVDPLHSRKMVARLQAAKANALLRTSGSTGHGGGTPLSARIAENVDIYSFLFAALGVTPK